MPDLFFAFCQYRYGMNIDNSPATNLQDGQLGFRPTG